MPKTKQTPRESPAAQPAPASIWSPAKIAAGIVLVAVVGGAIAIVLHRRPAEVAVHASSPAAVSPAPTSTPADMPGMAASFGPTVPNTKPAPAQPPKGMA